LPEPGSLHQFTAAQGGLRLDQFLAAQGLELTRSQVQRLIEEGQVQLNGQPARSSQRIKPGDRITLTVPPPRTLDLVAQAMPLTVVYQDAELLVVDKPAGLAVHPGPGHPDRTLVNALLALCPDLPGVGGAVRPGIVHRLDKDTSGLMVVAKTHRAHLALSAQIKDRQVVKGYLALAVGVPEPPQGVVDAPIARDPRRRQRMAVVLGGREARTRYRVVERLGGHSPAGERHSLLEVYLESGRTHQIRVHLAYLGHPLLGDAVYGKSPSAEGLARQFLHAFHLAFTHPVTGQALDFRAPLPADLQGVLEQLGSRYAALPVG
jgi:23S rRNA pseudouridine1911/1915/1917 synthase